MWLVPLFFVLLSWQPTEASAESFTCQQRQEIRGRVDWSLHEELTADCVFFRRGPEDARQEREPLAGSFTPLRMCRDESTLNGHA